MVYYIHTPGNGPGEMTPARNKKRRKLSEVSNQLKGPVERVQIILPWYGFSFLRIKSRFSIDKVLSWRVQSKRAALNCKFKPTPRMKILTIVLTMSQVILYACYRVHAFLQ